MAQDYTIGRLYSGIRAEKTLESEDEFKPQKAQDPKYVQICKRIYKVAPSLGTPKVYSEQMQSAIDFLDWKLKAEEYNGATKIVAFSSIVLTFIISLLIYIAFILIHNNTSILDSFPFSANLILLISIFLFGSIFGAITYYFFNYPDFEVSREQRRSLVYLPQIVGYIVMSLKLVPNMERAVKFAAIQGEGKLAEDLKKLIWEVNIGVYPTVNEGLDKLAYKWQKYSKEFKEAIMMIKSSMVEDNDARRTELLDKAMENVLSSIKIKMEGYARTLSQPSLILFYVGVLLPLLLVIILPIGSVFAKLPFSGPIFLIAVYNVILPLFVFFYAKYVIDSVPTLYRPPKISDDYKGLPKKGYFKIRGVQINLKLFIGLILLIGISIAVILQLQYGITIEKVMKNDNLPQKYIDAPDTYFEFLANESLRAKGVKNITEDIKNSEVEKQRMLYLMQPGHDITPYFIVYGIAIVLALCIFLYLFFDSKYKKDVQDYYVNMEQEFKEILYILASRLGEGKPMEEALKSTREFFPDLSVSQDLLAKTLDNLNLLGMPIEQAFYDPLFGSLKNNPSNLIRNNIKLISDSVTLGVITGAKTTLSIIVQLKNTDEIKELVKKVTQDIVQMMNTMATLIAPAVLGITTSMQKIVVLTLNSLASSGIANNASQLNNNEVLGGIGINPSQLLGTFNMDNITLASPATFNIIIIIYVILLVSILSYFTSRLQTDNPIETKMLISYTVPIAIIIFIVSATASGLLLGGGLGG